MIRGNDLRTARLGCGISLGQLARMIDRDKGHLSRVETGSREATPALIRDYEQALGVRVAAPIDRRADAAPTDGDGTSDVTQTTGAPDRTAGVEASPGTHLSGAGGVTALSEWDELSMIHRRDFLAGAAGLSALAHLESYLVTLQREPAAQVAVLRAALSAQRLRDGTLPPTELADIVAGHLRLLRDVAVAAGDEETVASAHEAASEGFGFLAWLAWDTWEIGSAQRHYRTAVRFARASGHPTLPAYMLGSAAAFAAQTGDLHRAVLLVGRSQQALPVRRHPVADAWMDAVSASVYAAAGDEHETWRSLDAAETAVGRIPHGEAPPWPWIMRFDKAKLAGYRLTAAVDLRRPQVALDAARDLTAGTNPNRNAQHGLTLLREADAHAQAGDYDQCAALATHALVTAAPTSSQRVIRAAWHTRHAIPGQTTSEEIRRFDAALHGTDPADI